MRARFTAICAALVAAPLVAAGCTLSTPGQPVAIPDQRAEPSFPTQRPTRTSPPPTPSAGPAPSDTPAAEVLTPENGYVFIETKSGRTRCQLSTAEVGCETQFVNPPVVDGVPANGVRLNAAGELLWVVGNLGAIPAVTLEYRTYRAVGWTIDASESGTRFTHHGTGHGMTIATEGVETF